MSTCFTCGGYGFSDRVCPECEKAPGSLNFNNMENNREFVTESKNIEIPEFYIGLDWSREIFLKKFSEEDKKNLLLGKYSSQLEKINKMFSEGLLPSKSAIIIAPPQFSKTTFAYSCMQHALNHGFKVARLLDTIEVKRLLLLASENIKYRLYGKIDYDEYITSDVLFVTVTKTDYCTEAYSIILELLDRRSRLGLPTFILSRFSLETMSRRDYAGHFQAIKDFNSLGSDLKYPTIISFVR